MHQLNAIVRSLPMEIWPLRRNRPWSDLSKTRRRWPRAATPPGLTGGQRWIGRTAWDTMVNIWCIYIYLYLSLSMVYYRWFILDDTMVFFTIYVGYFR